MQQLPIGEQNFANLRQLNMLYVDKTEAIHRLVQGSRYNFLSRPRRFGKSLTLSTIRHIFQGEKELFKGLWIENQWDWSVQHPVVHLSFTGLDYHRLGLEQALNQFLDERAAESGLVLKRQTIKEKLRELIIELARQQASVVFLVDEYDKPLIDFLQKNELHLAKENRAILKNFYSGLKDDAAQAALRFFLITGVSKFSQVSLFSDLNYLADLSLDARFGTLVGYTQTELLDNFADYLDALNGAFPQVDRAELIERIREWYNGYSWDGVSRVYNPFSILLLFQKLQFGDFWFKSGTPTFLINLLKEQELYVVDEMRVSGILFDSYDLENMDARALMFQTGYLTVKQYDPYRNRYILGYPNREVEEALNNYLIASLLNRMPTDALRPVELLEDGFLQNDLSKVITVINSLLKDLPSHLLADKTEHFYHALIHLHFRYLGLYLESEVHTSDGRMDAVVQTPTHVYIIEFKLNLSASIALAQIIDKQYAEKYRLSPKTLIGIGISFDTEKKAVKEWETQEL
ncbi:ATP-binding protein [Haliscomenobacter hydrossis]|uniref:AAA-ATPase n=1 Tax=Haliscomenobacter hydrossis (strain ATCC 27775 / DSM 1100 / LMG 10767 / O) TaxID=760192 RepID=F4L2K8_HALH1|nr:ATP-binding protein [Haliscomenobacter hydrossis]AEE53926.1 AAA-ATPase [Haliscomenobacter hydrossis DSM 1100]